MKEEKSIDIPPTVCELGVQYDNWRIIYTVNGKFPTKSFMDYLLEQGFRRC